MKSGSGIASQHRRGITQNYKFRLEITSVSGCYIREFIHNARKEEFICFWGRNEIYIFKTLW